MITGEWTRNRLLQTIVVLYALYVAGLWLTNALLYFSKMGLTAASVVEYYLGSEERFLSPRSYQGLLEVSHFHLFAMGMLGFAAFNGFFYTALLYTTAINTTIIQAGMPMFIFVLGFLFFRSRTSMGQAMGYSLTLCGVAVAALRGEIDQLAEFQINRGDLIMLIAAFIYAAYSVALQAKPNIHWLSFLSVLVTSATVTAFPMALYESTTDAFIWPRTVTGWSVVAYTAIFPSMLSQLFFIRGVATLGANRAGLFINLVPIFGALLAVVILEESFRLYHLAGLSLVLGGIAMAERFGERRNV